MKKLVKRAYSAITTLTLTTLCLMLVACGGGSAGGVSSQVVSGTAAVGAPLSGQVSLKDSSSPALLKSTVIGSDGSFAIDVTAMKAPYVLQATGHADGTAYKLHSFAEGPGTANINPLSDVIVASAAGDDNPSDVFEKTDSDKNHKIKNNYSNMLSILMAKLQPLLKQYSAEHTNPITSRYIANHLGLDDMFDHVKITVSNGILSIINTKSGAVIFSGKVSDIANGTFDGGAMPPTGTVPATPTALTAVGGTGQVTLSWTSVSNATSYNVYYATTSGVTAASGTKISSASTPHVQTGLAANTTYYYVVTAANSVGESAASAQASAATSSTVSPPSAPTAPAGAIATGGTTQVTLSWGAVSTATSYNVYYAMTSGVTKSNGTKITNATTPVVQTGLTAGTTYYYIVTAVNSVGEGTASVQISATTLPAVPSATAPLAPTGVTAVGGATQATITWPAVAGADSYNVYWSATNGVTKTSGTKVAGVTSPYVKTGLSAGTTYYFIVTAANSVGESSASIQASAATNAPPAQACGSCHAIPPATGQHDFHVNQQGFDCATCHGAGYSKTAVTAATHMNGTINVSLTAWNPATKSCASYCHGGRSW